MKSSFFSNFAPKAILLAFALAAASCSSKKEETTPTSTTVELPAAVIATYGGQLSYTGSSIIGSSNGTATISKSGDKTYSITFSDRVPAITNLKFQSASGGNYATVGSDGSTAGMTLTSSDLNIGVTKGSETWGFSGTK
ncbi:hypothetical protein GCM10022409_25890 [Hymenobacter glaciei]|uniref:Uncharacterized protein n=1 Tax=Hymenobacter glaciei TaxID=877209 RepID=A0ABP7UCU0_9BACT